MPPATLPMVLDCDPGHDDAVALLFLLASPELDLLGLTVTHGNVPLERTRRNALDLLHFAGSDVRVYAGAERPLVRDSVFAPQVHGASGLGEVTLPASPRSTEATRAAEFLIETALASPGEVTLVATGPLTNVALALRLEPRLAQSLKDIVVMGGSLEHGNVTPAAEFNFFADPHAAQIVVSSGARVTMFGLDVTRQVPVSRNRIAELRSVGSKGAVLCADLLSDYLGRLEARGRDHLAALHDPCPATFLARPALFELQDVFVSVDVSQGENFGRSTADLTVASGRQANVRAARQADADGVYSLLRERLARI